MLTALMRYNNPRLEHRTETVATIIRIVYEQMIKSGQSQPREGVAAEEYEGWAARWGLDAPHSE